MNNDLSFEQIKHLINITEEIVSKIYSVIFESHALMESPIFERDRFHEIEILAKAHKDKLKVYEDYFEMRRNESNKEK